MTKTDTVPGMPTPSDPEVSLLLQTVWNLLVAGEHWPTYTGVDRLLSQQHELDIDPVIARTPTELLRGGRPQGGARALGDEQLGLTLAGAAACEGSRPAVEVVVAAAQLAAAYERAADPAGGTPTVTFEQVAARLARGVSLRADVARQSGLLLHTEPWTGYVMLHEGGWQVAVDRRARPYADVRDLGSYWAVRQEQEQRGTAPGTADEEARAATISDHVIHLNRRWVLGDQLDKGGFGRVFAGTADDGSPVAVKLVPKEPGADRELLFAKPEGGVRNVVPVLDSGETDNDYVIVMPRADASLKNHLGEAGGSLPTDEALAALTDIATALADLDGRIVHRDIKPGNVLLINGRWCLADFGISRYTEASTAPDTQKYALSAAYAAPERWRWERATAATDVYAVGIMAFELLVGHLPFSGPGLDEFRDQHLHGDPPPLEGLPPQLAALIQDCLAKPPQARPSPRTLLDRLHRVAAPQLTPGKSALAMAYRRQSEQRAAAGTAASRLMSEQERRRGLASAASRSLEVISTSLLSVVTDLAPDIPVTHRADGGWHVELGGARFGLSAAEPDHKRNARWPFDVIAHATVNVAIPPNRAGWEGRSHALWYCDAGREEEYGWFETAFMMIVGGSRPREPFALPPEGEAEAALAPMLTRTQVAWPFTKLVAGETDEFIDRWVGWFAAAVNGELFRPSALPERDPAGSWRR